MNVKKTLTSFLIVPLIFGLLATTSVSAHGKDATIFRTSIGQSVNPDGSVKVTGSGQIGGTEKTVKSIDYNFQFTRNGYDRGSAKGTDKNIPSSGLKTVSRSFTGTEFSYSGNTWKMYLIGQVNFTDGHGVSDSSVSTVKVFAK